jgi:hypothetical protein
MRHSSPKSQWTISFSPASSRAGNEKPPILEKELGDQQSRYPYSWTLTCLLVPLTRGIVGMDSLANEMTPYQQILCQWTMFRQHVTRCAPDSGGEWQTLRLWWIRSRAEGASRQWQHQLLDIRAMWGFWGLGHFWEWIWGNPVWYGRRWWRGSEWNNVNGSTFQPNSVPSYCDVGVDNRSCRGRWGRGSVTEVMICRKRGD